MVQKQAIIDLICTCVCVCVERRKIPQTCCIALKTALKTTDTMQERVNACHSVLIWRTCRQSQFGY